MVKGHYVELAAQVRNEVMKVLKRVLLIESQTYEIAAQVLVNEDHGIA